MSEPTDHPRDPDPAASRTSPGANLPRVPSFPQRFVYLGTPDMAVPPLRALHTAGHDIALVITRADKRRGRGSHVQPSPVKAAAQALGLPVSHDLDDALGVGADAGIVVAYGRIIPRHVLEGLPMVNIHFSLLPRWRGAAPVERAILAGDTQTGVDLMAVEEGLDTGGIYAEARIEIAPDDTAEVVRARLVSAGTLLLLETLAAGIGEPAPQQGEPTYAEKLTPDTLRIDWTQPAEVINRCVRVGGAWTMFRGQRFKVWAAAVRAAPSSIAAGEIAGLLVGTGDQLLELIEVQPEGKARLAAKAWRNGAQIRPGEGFDAPAASTPAAGATG